MILLHISSPNRPLLHLIAEKLLREKFVSDIRIDSIRRLTMENDKLVEVPRSLLACKTKALLFNQIVDFLRENIEGELPEIYALPLVFVEKSQEEIIRGKTKAV